MRSCLIISFLHPRINIKITGLSELTPRKRINYKKKCLRRIPMLSAFGRKIEFKYFVRR